MSDKRKLSTILGLCGATILAGGGSSFLTNTGLSLVDKSQQVVQEANLEPEQRETEQPLTVEQFSSTKDSFVISAKEVLAKAQGEGDEPAGSTGNSNDTMYATGQVNIRSDADADSEILGTLDEGEGIQVTGNTSEGWVEVSYNGGTGYVSGNYLTGGGNSGSSGGSSSGGSSGGSSSGSGSTGGSSSGGGSTGGSSSGGSSGGSSSGGSSDGGSQSGPAVIVTAGTMYATEGVNVRSGPGSDYRVLGTIEAGEGIAVTGGESNGWIEVVYNGQVGYIYHTYLVWDPDEISSGSSGNSGAWDDSYYFYDINLRYISADELDGWSATDLSYLRNEIFARHGRIFTMQKYRDYFSQKTWYNPTYDPSYFDSNLDSFLNEYEWANLKVIQRLEDERS